MTVIQNFIMKGIIGMNKQEYMELGEKYLFKTYNRYKIILEKGEGVYLYDTENKKYLDFASGIGVFALGYGNVDYNRALKSQIDKLMHTSNLYYNVPAIEAAEKICKVSGMSKVFFTNSGTEAVEGAIKLARRFAYNKDKKTDHEIIAMNNSFHGRSLGALSVTGNEKYQAPFKPLIGGIKFADYNDLNSVEKLVSDKTCAIITETVQGEGGLYPADVSFMQGLRKICDENDILLICDEIQCGMGRTGKMFAYEHYGIQPDIITLAKALGCGVPIGAFLANAKAAPAMVPGDHGTTYGGNPFVTAAAGKVLDLFEVYDILNKVNSTGKYLEQQLDSLAEQYDEIITRRGIGLMQGLEFRNPVGEIVTDALENGLIILTAGTNVLRFLPPLIISNSDIDLMIAILRNVIDKNIEN